MLAMAEMAVSTKDLRGRREEPAEALASSSSVIATVTSAACTAAPLAETAAVCAVAAALASAANGEMPLGELICAETWEAGETRQRPATTLLCGRSTAAALGL